MNEYPDNEVVNMVCDNEEATDLLYEKYEIKLDILYGGSVNDENIEELCGIKGLSGFLVGGASLDVDKVKGMILEMEK